MKRIILWGFAIFISATNSFAQEADSLQLESLCTRVDSLSRRLDQLQCDYDYFKCEYDLTLLQNELELFCQQTKNNSQDLIIDSYHNKLDIDFYITCKKMYDNSVEWLNVMKEKSIRIQDKIDHTVLVSNFSDKQNEQLKELNSLVKSAFSIAESALNLYKASLDFYKER